MPSATRKRPAEEFEQTGNQAGPQILTLGSLVGGYNGYVSPDLLSPQFWAACSNVYAGQFGAIRRARWAPIVTPLGLGPLQGGGRMSSMFGYYPPTGSPYLILDLQTAGGYGNTPVTTIYGSGVFTATTDLTGQLSSPTVRRGPYMRVGVQNGSMILEANGQLRSKLFLSGGIFFFEFWGFDTPDSTTQVTLVSGLTATIAGGGAVRAGNTVTITTTGAHGLALGEWVSISGVTDTSFNNVAGTAFQILSVPSGTTFTYFQVGANATSGTGTVTLGITKNIGRSYQWAWEDANTGHVSAPSPASQFVKYTSQFGVIDLIEPGTVAVNNGSAAVVGTGTAFTPAWVGRFLWIEGTTGVTKYSVSAVADATHLTLGTPWTATNQATSRFQVYDLKATHLRLYATGDGQPVYFLIGRNPFNNVTPTIGNSGLEFNDYANSEPPNPPFSSEIAQLYNVPPPIGTFLQDYQGRILVYGVPAALGTFFYSNVEATVVGQAPESFSPLNTVAIPIGDGQLNGMSNLPTGLIIWSNRQDMFKLTGLLSDNTIASSTQLGATIQRLPYKIGCASPYATAVTPLGTIWLSSDREVWLFTDHYAPKNVGKPIQDVLNQAKRINFARASYYKAGDRSWFALAISLDGIKNNKLLLLDLDLLASNGQPSYFTFDMATNAPTWYQYDINCEALTTAYDANSTNHLLVGDLDTVTEVDWQTGYYTYTAEQPFVLGTITLHAFGNEDPEMIKTLEWLRAMTNQQPSNLQAQFWSWFVNSFDDDVYVIGVNPLVSTNLGPGVTNNPNSLFLEYSPALFKFGGTNPLKGRRFQIGTIFPSAPGLWELRGFQIKYTSVVAR